MTQVYIGNIIRISGAFTDVNGAAVDPTTVTLRIKPPSGSTVVVTNATKDSVGNYHYDYTPTLKGKHYYRWEGTGACVTANEGDFQIEKSKIV